MNNIEDLVYNAMQSSLEGYAASVVDSIEFELKRELTTEEHQQVFVAVDRAITGIEAAQKERDALREKFNEMSLQKQFWVKCAAESESKLEKAEAALSAAIEKPEPISFDELADRVQFVTGGIRMSFDPLNCKGHQIVPFMNFNSLSRIVEMYRTTETYHLAGFMVEGNADAE